MNGMAGIGRKQRAQTTFMTITMFSVFSKDLHKVRWKDQKKHHFESNGEMGNGQTAKLTIQQ